MKKLLALVLIVGLLLSFSGCDLMDSVMDGLGYVPSSSEPDTSKRPEKDDPAPDVTEPAATKPLATTPAETAPATKEIACPDCDGSGEQEYEYDTEIACFTCDGAGRQKCGTCLGDALCILCGGDGIKENGNTCSICDGTGKCGGRSCTNGYTGTCYSCDGTGTKEIVASDYEECSRCKGTGTIVVADDSAAQPNTPTRPNTNSGGSGSCSHCGGSGDCNVCTLGDCNFCLGEGTEDCSRCFGSGACQSCEGTGGGYSGYGDNFEWRDCSSCDGDGECGRCDGSGAKKCSYCYGSGNCSSCNGTEQCPYC